MSTLLNALKDLRFESSASAALVSAATAVSQQQQQQQSMLPAAMVSAGSGSVDRPASLSVLMRVLSDQADRDGFRIITINTEPKRVIMACNRQGRPPPGLVSSSVDEPAVEAESQQQALSQQQSPPSRPHSPAPPTPSVVTRRSGRTGTSIRCGCRMRVNINYHSKLRAWRVTSYEAAHNHSYGSHAVSATQDSAPTDSRIDPTFRVTQADVRACVEAYVRQFRAPPSDSSAAAAMLAGLAQQMGSRSVAGRPYQLMLTPATAAAHSPTTSSPTMQVHYAAAQQQQQQHFLHARANANALKRPLSAMFDTYSRHTQQQQHQQHQLHSPPTHQRPRTVSPGAAAVSPTSPRHYDHGALRRKLSVPDLADHHQHHSLPHSLASRAAGYSPQPPGQQQHARRRSNSAVALPSLSLATAGEQQSPPQQQQPPSSSPRRHNPLQSLATTAIEVDRYAMLYAAFKRLIAVACKKRQWTEECLEDIGGTLEKYQQQQTPATVKHAAPSLSAHSGSPYSSGMHSPVSAGGFTLPAPVVVEPDDKEKEQDALRDSETTPPADKIQPAEVQVATPISAADSAVRSNTPLRVVQSAAVGSTTDDRS